MLHVPALCLSLYVLHEFVSSSKVSDWTWNGNSLSERKANLQVADKSVCKTFRTLVSQREEKKETCQERCELWKEWLITSFFFGFLGGVLHRKKDHLRSDLLIYHTDREMAGT